MSKSQSVFHLAPGLIVASAGVAAMATGARSNPEAAPMRAIVARLDNSSIVAVAAYAATLKP